MTELVEQLKSFGLARLGVIIGVGFAVAAFLGFFALRMGTPDYSVLYADLDYVDAQEVIQRLEQDGVSHKIRERGNAISVLAPRREIAALRLLLASDGVVVAQGVGYEIFDQQDTFGATRFQQNINRLRALEGELGRTIAKINGVRAARVHLVLPERQLFAREETAPSASIIVNAPGGLAPQSVKAIVNLAASAVPQLKPNDVTVLDAQGVLLASGQPNEADALDGMDARVASAEQRIRRTVEDIIAPIVGAENMRVQVSAELDFSRVTESAEIIDPDSQSVLSTTLIEEDENRVDPGIAAAVTVGNTVPGATPATGSPQSGANGAPTNGGAANRRTEETTNYEFSRRTRNEVHEIGGVKRLSIALALNANGAGPRSDEEIAQLTALVRSAVGFDAGRGDQIEVLETSFTPLAASPDAIAPPTSGAPAPTWLSANLTRLLELAALALAGFALIFFVLRPMLVAKEAQATLENRVAKTAVGGPANSTKPALEGALTPNNQDGDQSVDLSHVAGQVSASSIRQITDIVKTHRNESALILKNWIQEGANS